MTPHELIALVLGMSVAASAAAWAVGVLIERVCDDPGLRDGVWGVGLGLSLLPVLAVSILLLTPAPVREVAATVAPTVMVETAPVATATASVIERPSLPGGSIAWTILAAASVAGLIRLGALVLGTVRLVRLIRRATPADVALQDRVLVQAATLKVRAPRTVVSETTSEALLSGFGRPCLILPASIQPAADAVIAHELAHLKRGDHRTLWLEEALSIVLAFNPLIPLLRARRDAAREEACDALALSDAAPEARRAYAQALIDALRSRAAPSGARAPRVALTFTGAGRTTAMHRLKAVTTPAAPAGPRARLIAASACLALVATIASASWAVAAQRTSETRVSDTSDTAASLPDFAYTSAALNPVYRVAWPTACGFGTENGDRLMVYAGDCATGEGSRIEILTLAGVSVLPDTRAAFTAVKAACDAGRTVEIAYAENGLRGRTTVACAAPAEAPAEPVRFTVALSYDPAIPINAGDRLEIELSRDVDDKGGTASTGIVLDLAPGALPGQAFAELRPPLLPADLRTGSPFTLSARIISADGTVKAVSDRERGRPFAPYVISEGVITTAVRMVPTEQVAEAAPPGGGFSVEADALAQPDSEALAALPRPAAGLRRLWVGLDADAVNIVPGDRLIIRLAGSEADDAFQRTLSHTVTDAGPPGVFAMDLDGSVFPRSGNRAYSLTAAVERDGRIVFNADAATLRFAPGSQGSVARLRPILQLEALPL